MASWTARRMAAKFALHSMRRAAMALAAESTFAECAAAVRHTQCGSISDGSRSRASQTMPLRQTDMTTRRFECCIYLQGMRAKVTSMRPSIKFARRWDGIWSSKNLTLCAGRSSTLAHPQSGLTCSLKSRPGLGMLSFFHHRVALSAELDFTLRGSLAPGRCAPRHTCVVFRGSAMLTRQLWTLPTSSSTSVSGLPSFNAP